MEAIVVFIIMIASIIAEMAVEIIIEIEVFIIIVIIALAFKESSPIVFKKIIHIIIELIASPTGSMALNIIAMSNGELAKAVDNGGPLADCKS